MPLSAFPVTLHAWLERHDAHVRAAVRLLADHGHWLTDPVFADVAIHRAGHIAYLDWDAAARALDGGVFAAASESERTILRVAIALGRDDHDLSTLSEHDRALVLRALTDTLYA